MASNVFLNCFRCKQESWICCGLWCIMEPGTNESFLWESLNKEDEMKILVRTSKKKNEQVSWQNHSGFCEPVRKLLVANMLAVSKRQNAIWHQVHFHWLSLDNYLNYSIHCCFRSTLLKLWNTSLLNLNSYFQKTNSKTIFCQR